MGNECSACGQCQKTEKTNELQINVFSLQFLSLISFFREILMTIQQFFKSLLRKKSPKGKICLLLPTKRNLKIIQIMTKINNINPIKILIVFSLNFLLFPINFFLLKSKQYFTEEEPKDLPSQPSDPKTLEKRPPFTFKSGAIYEGEWKGNIREGFGKQSWPDGARYEGEWMKNKAEGQGTFWHIDGDIFTGQWKEDKANGYGVYTHMNGAKYEGYWKDDLQEGQGTEVWSDGSKYEGNYKEGKKHGYGLIFQFI